MLNEKENLKKYAFASCNQFDGLNCWLLYQIEIWENLSKTIKRKDLTYDDKELTLENIRNKVELDPLDENVFIHQQDIEEMDHRQCPRFPVRFRSAIAAATSPVGVSITIAEPRSACSENRVFSASRRVVWKANEAKSVRTFQMITGEKIASPSRVAA